MKRGSKLNRQLDRYLGIPLVWALGRFRRPRSIPSHVNRVGIICAPALGDTLLVSGPIADLISYFKGSEFILFCTPQNKASADLIPGIRRRVLYRVTNFVGAVRSMRREQLDVLIDFSPWQRFSAACTAFSGARFTVGFRTENQYRHFCYDRFADHTNVRHELENFRALLRSIDIPTRHDPFVSPPRADLPKALRDREAVVFHLWPSGARSWLREWPAERWIELAVELHRSINNPIFVITGSPAEESRSASFAVELRKHGCEALVFTGTDGFASLCRLLQASRLTVSVNTGVMHLAAVLGVPTVSINGPTNNLRWGPLGPNAIGVNAGQGCGFLDLGFEFDGNPSDCMQRISVPSVLEAAIASIRRASAVGR